MANAQVGGAADPIIVYGKNSSGVSVSVGSVLMENVVDGAGDGYGWVLPDIDTSKPESLVARKGVVYASDTTLTFADGDDIALIVEGYTSEVLVDGSSPNVAKGDQLICQDASQRLVVATNVDRVVDAITGADPGAFTSAGASPIKAEYDASSVAYRAAILELIADVTALRANILALMDAPKIVAIAHEVSASATGSIAATIIKR